MSPWVPWQAKVAGAMSVVVGLVVVVLLATQTSPAPAEAHPVSLVASAASDPVPAVEPTTEAPVAPAAASVPEPAPAPQPAVVARDPEPVVDDSPPAADPPAPAESDAQRCSDDRQWVAAHGVVLPAGFGFKCPDTATFPDGSSKWGLMCFNCGIGTGSYIAINVDRIGPSDDTLRYVIAHETCHAIEDVLTGTTTEEDADACAAAHGAPRP